MRNRPNIKMDAYKLVFWQFIVVAILAVILWFLRDLQSGLSVILGGLSYILPNLLFVWRVFARTSAQAAREFLLAFIMGEAIKLILSAVVFVLIVKYLPVNVIAVLGGYIAAIVAFWIVSFIFMSHEQPGKGQ